MLSQRSNLALTPTPPTDGIVTGKAGSTYIVLGNIPANKDSIAVADGNGKSMKFDWVQDTTTLYFPKTPDGGITVAYEHRFQLFTLVWPEEQAVKGARTRQV